MNATKTLTVCLLTCLGLFSLQGISHAQNFGTRSPIPTTFGSGGSLVNPAYTAPRSFAAQRASYRVERDPRYLQSLPAVPVAGFNSAGTTAFRPPAGGSGCRGGGYPGAAPVYRGQSASSFAPQLPASYTSPATAGGGFSPYRVPAGYYRGDGLFGKDTVFAENQPVRNIFRYLLP